MKVFHIVENFVHHYHPEYQTAAEASARFHPSFLFVDAPDFVFEGWGYDPEAEGDDRFIKPTPPEGWLYDDASGTFYQEGRLPESQKPTYEELLAAYNLLTGGSIRV